MSNLLKSSNDSIMAFDNSSTTSMFTGNLPDVEPKEKRLMVESEARKKVQEWRKEERGVTQAQIDEKISLMPQHAKRIEEYYSRTMYYEAQAAVRKNDYTLFKKQLNMFAFNCVTEDLEDPNERTKLGFLLGVWTSDAPNDFKDKFTLWNKEGPIAEVKIASEEDGNTPISK